MSGILIFIFASCEPLRNILYRGSVNLKQIAYLALLNKTFTPPDLKITHTVGHLKIHIPPVVQFSKIFHRGCMDFKWSSPNKASSNCYYLFILKYYNPNTFTGVAGKVQKKLSPEGVRKGGWSTRWGPGLEPRTYRMLGEGPQLNATGVV